MISLFWIFTPRMGQRNSVPNVIPRFPHTSPFLNKLAPPLFMRLIVYGHNLPTAAGRLLLEDGAVSVVHVLGGRGVVVPGLLAHLTEKVDAFEPFFRTGFGFDFFWFQLLRRLCHGSSPRKTTYITTYTAHT